MKRLMYEAILFICSKIFKLLLIMDLANDWSMTINIYATCQRTIECKM